MIPIRVSRLSDWKIYGSQWGRLRSTLIDVVCSLSCGRSGMEIDNTPYIIKAGRYLFLCGFGFGTRIACRWRNRRCRGRGGCGLYFAYQ